MASAKLIQNTIELPQEICAQAGFQDGDEFEIKVISEHILQLERLEHNAAAEKPLADFLKQGFALGVKGKVTREEIYDDLD